MKDIIDKAVKGGFSEMYAQWFLDMCNIHDREKFYAERLFNYLIFSHDFLKAFFGEEMIDHECFGNEDSYCSLPSWQYHAQQLVLSTDRKEYLKRFI